MAGALYAGLFTGAFFKERGWIVYFALLTGKYVTHISASRSISTNPYIWVRTKYLGKG